MASFLNCLLYGIGGLACTCLVLLITFQEKLVYVPVVPGLTRSYPITPARLHLTYEDVWLTASDGVRLHSWFIKLFPECRGPTILFFQENAGNIAHRLEFVDLMMQRLRCNIFMLSYRGYGDSHGFPSQHGLIKDAQAALDHLVERTDIDSTRLVVFGRSLGGAVGVALVKNNPGKVAALILENTFTSILDMAGIMLPILKWFIGGTGSKGLKVMNFLVWSPWNTIDIIQKVSEPVLFLSGSRDEMVPPSHMQRLFAASSNSRSLFIEFPTGTHMDTWVHGGDRYWRSIQLFLEKYVGSRSDGAGGDGGQGCVVNPE
eukprot:c40343_g1_i1 orf=493-1443(-)